MATVGTYSYTISDWARSLDPDGQIAAAVEILNKTNRILDDMIWIEGNLPTGHKTTIRSGLPTLAWRMLNYGVQPSKSRKVQVTDTCGMLEGYSDVDKSLANLNGNTAAFRASEDKSFLEKMSQDMATAIIYANTGTDPEQIMGLSPRYNSLSAENAGNIINGGGSGSDNTSIWLVIWGSDTCHGIFPKGQISGLQVQDLGEVTLTDDQTPTGYYQGYRTHYKWDAGLVLRDWRYVVRICNIDVSNLVKDASSGADLIDLMIQATEIPPNLDKGRAVFYCNKTIKSMLRRQILNKSNVNLTWDNVSGKHVLNFDGIPVQKVDAILSTETAVS